ncbi:MAG: phosphoenolpyruvate carboxykinase (ATP) [Acidiferrobacteraceae bacterium]|jgi:phosphoenolpyruvate carboxykinase (ATP)|nr:phosphoenolpyruvate carboxykinase (ATP) [Acidiferrobacteraceae bacterium]MCP4830353.1 phosphoenolpyruvate carboxykinase [Pseudomonadota bacterium]MDP6951089.1 phosphoenolpyruvate carboxykinase [Arenicellales bacterium]HJP06547.1 phosphoenolpyruvate carboxykinase [Arenicellales bacterium]|tara:strand:- start:2107 stop:3708 length:1602 start_codon:yes stop_codon:yes gene_type:complete
MSDPKLHSPFTLENHGLHNLGTVYWNLSQAVLTEHAIRKGEGVLASNGPLVVETGQHTGRSANDKFVVRDENTENEIWWGKINVPYAPERFDALFARMVQYLEGRELYVQDCFAGADPDRRLPVRIINELAWHSAFARNMFIVGSDTEQASHEPGFTVINAPGFSADPDVDGTNSPTFIIVNFSRKLVIIGGTSYAGETKKSIFSVMNYLLPRQGILSMHASANIGRDGSTAVFFGLSGTGKTTLSADAARTLIGDDEHGWSESGIFNFEGGCYAKVINLSAEQEPEIYQTTRTFGTILENVVLDDRSRTVDLDDGTLTENTRASYPISQIPNATPTGRGGQPNNIIFLTCDAFGVLPPVARLTPAQAMYHFINGYTAKVAGTEKGVTEPSPTFSPCFGGPFLPLHPRQYAELLGANIEKHNVKVWFINTGWTGGPYGVGKRMAINHTRTIVNAALDGKLDHVPTTTDPVFGLEVPIECPGVPVEVLNPRTTWSDAQAYDAQAHKLAGLFQENFSKYADDVPEAVRTAGPLAA